MKLGLIGDLMKEIFFTTPIMTSEYPIICIPKEVSQHFTSRGLVIGKVTTSSNSIVLPFEPDGYGSHWFDCSKLLLNNTNKTDVKPIEVEIDTAVPWFAPEVPEDFLDEIKRSDLLITWETITVKAKWEWIRWVRSTQQAKTRATRISAACDKLAKGMKRPCCFDQTRCSIPELSTNGKLIIKV